MKFKEACNYILDQLATDLSKELSYHSVGHTKDVYQAAKKIGQSEKITNHELELVLTAACYHDSGFLKGPKDHELESCCIANKVLVTFDYSKVDINAINGIIMATRIPQSPNNHLEEILADADLDYLGRDDFFAIAEKLFHEFMAFGVITNREEWNNMQVKFLESHHYFTATAVKMRQAKKEENLKIIKAQL